MPQPKLELFEKELQGSAVMFKALGHPARLAILQFLTETDTCYTGDISSELPLARTTVNQHLDELKKAGLIQGHINGSRTNYCLNPGVIKDLRRAMESLLNSLDCCKPLYCD
jgi:DNA-binding transcriptional ArsR family regulator